MAVDEMTEGLVSEAGRRLRRAMVKPTVEASGEWVEIRPSPRPWTRAGLGVVGVGTAWGTLIGFAAGGVVGAFYFVIGAIFGAPIGATVGLFVGFVVSVVLVAVLLIDRGPVVPAKAEKRIALFLAVLLTVLVLLASAVSLGIGVRSGGVAIWGGVAGLAPVAAAALVVWLLLRRAHPHLVAAWLRPHGWEWSE